MDHYFQMEFTTSAEEPMHEAYTTLGYLAAKTERMTLGVLVTGVMYRYPGLLAKIVTTLDVLSGGPGPASASARRGTTASSAASVYRSSRRVSASNKFFEETLQICLQMWSDNNGRFDGKHYQLAETLCVPAPISRPHPDHDRWEWREDAATRGPLRRLVQPVRQ